MQAITANNHPSDRCDRMKVNSMTMTVVFPTRVVFVIRTDLYLEKNILIITVYRS